MRAQLGLACLALAGCAELIGIEDVLPPGGGGSCGAAVSYGSPAQLNPIAERPSDGSSINYSAQLNAEVTPDGIAINLVDGAGVYADPSRPIEPVTNLGLTGDEANLATCGACVVLLSDVDVLTRSYKEMYIAMGGSITVSSVSPRLKGTLTDVTFVQITLDDAGNQTTVPDGCASHVASFAFDTQVTQAAN
jgi:hypothetical protein